MALVLMQSAVYGPFPSPVLPPRTFQHTPANTEPIRIGLLIPDSLKTNAEKSARMAIDEFNEKGGLQDRRLQLVVRSTEGPWGAGSKESVGLVYEDHVSVILGALDGRNGHLAEQVAAKSQLTYLETLATESTLSQAFVPYFMRCIPNDDQQARAILKLADRQGGGNLAVLSDSRYDNYHAARSFQRIAALENWEKPWILTIPDSGTPVDLLLDQMRERDIRHLVIPFRTGLTRELLRSINDQLPGVNIYGTLTFIADLQPETRAPDELEGMFVIFPGILQTNEGKAFQERFEERYGNRPTLSCAYTYDGTAMILQAIRRAGADREAIRETLGTMKEFTGVTGPITFDDKGNRAGPIRFMRITRGIPVPVH